jgi:hypothetical protein
MIATGDGKLLLCNHSEEHRGVLVYGENGKYTKTVENHNDPDLVQVIPNITNFIY